VTVYLTNQKKLCLAVGATSEHLSHIKKGTYVVSDSLATRLEDVTGIKKVTWASAGREDSKIDVLLKKFFKAEKDRERVAISSLAETIKKKRTLSATGGQR